MAMLNMLSGAQHKKDILLYTINIVIIFQEAVQWL